MITFDHLAVTAPDLHRGIDHVQAQTGLTLPLGGAHPQMATHNAVARFTDDTYLEIITPNPAAKAPARPRWFNLDSITHPSLTAWILRTDDIDHCIASAAAFGIDIGRAMPLSRGALQWQFSLRHDGKIPLDGAAPLIIQWDTAGPHPASAMADFHMTLNQLTITTPNARKLRGLLACLGLETLPEIIQGDRTKLSATLELQDGTEALLT